MHRRTHFVIALFLCVQWGCSTSEGAYADPDAGSSERDGSLEMRFGALGTIRALFRVHSSGKEVENHVTVRTVEFIDRH